MSAPFSRTLYTLTQQFLQFGMVGSVGFMVDWGSTTLLRYVVPLKIAALMAYVVGASSTWLLNRLWTFRHTNHTRHTVTQQWRRFLLANLPGFILNRGTVLLILSTIPLSQHYPVIALLCGTLCGMFVNFTLCRTCVFSHKETSQTQIQ